MAQSIWVIEGIVTQSVSELSHTCTYFINGTFYTKSGLWSSFRTTCMLDTNNFCCTPKVWHPLQSYKARRCSVSISSGHLLLITFLMNYHKLGFVMYLYINTA